MSVLERAAGFEYDPPPARLVFYGEPKGQKASLPKLAKPLAEKVNLGRP